MPQTQAELQLLSRAENEQDYEERERGILWRQCEDAADEVGRKNVCYALRISEQLLSKQLRGVDGNRPSAHLLAYLVKHQKSGRLARWLLADYAGYLPPQRPDRLKPEEFAREIAAMANGGEFGASERQKVLSLYERMERPK